jgi:hypothetical protein
MATVNTLNTRWRGKKLGARLFRYNETCSDGERTGHRKCKPDVFIFYHGPPVRLTANVKEQRVGQECLKVLD